MNDKKSPLPWKPIISVAAGMLASILIVVLTLGVMSPMGFVIFGLMMVFSGIWVLTHSTIKWVKFFAVMLIFAPVVTVYVFFFGMIYNKL